MSALTPKTLAVEMYEALRDDYFQGADLHLFTNDAEIPSNFDNDLLDSLEEATFGGYAPISSVTFNEAYYTADGLSVTFATDSHQFDHDGSGDPVVSETIKGYWLEKDGDIVAAERITPQSVTGLNTSVTVQAMVNIKFPGR